MEDMRKTGQLVNIRAPIFGRKKVSVDTNTDAIVGASGHVTASVGRPPRRRRQLLREAVGLGLDTVQPLVEFRVKRCLGLHMREVVGSWPTAVARAIGIKVGEVKSSLHCNGVGGSHSH